MKGSTKKEPADIHIVKSNAFGISSLKPTELTSRLHSRKISEVFSPLRPESQRENPEYSESKLSVNKSSDLMQNFDSKQYRYTTSKERASDIKKIRIQMEEHKRKEIVKVREINKLMKSMGKEEHENNIRLFQKYNEDEKQIIKALISKAKEQDLNEKINQKLRIIKQGRRKEIRKAEKNFALNFSKQKNLIEKYEKAGEKSKRMRHEKNMKAGKIRTLRAFRTNKPKVQLSTQVFDTSLVDDKNNKERKYSFLTLIESSLNYQATMDTYRTEALTNSVRKVVNSQEPIRNMNVQQSYHSYRMSQKDNPHFSIRNSITHDGDENKTSRDSLHPKLPKNLYPGARSMTRIKYGNSVDQTISSIKGMMALPSIRNNEAQQLINNQNFKGNYSFM